MPFIQSGCIVSEYSWEGNIPQLPWADRPESIQTILRVSFEHGAQCLFSCVRICIYCDDTAETLAFLDSEWKIVPHSPSHCHLDTSDGPMASSLPIFNAIFKIEQFPNKSDIMHTLSTNRGISSLPSAQLTLIEDPQEEPSNILFEINRPLTADIQNVSVSFTGSVFLYTPGPFGSGRCLDGSFSVGRIVRVQPVVLPFNYKTAILPTEILFMIFENFYDPSLVYKSWRKDLLSCALVCKQWSCALDLLLSDFRYPVACQSYQWIGHPPEICSFANALVLRPSLGLSITHLSLDYFLQHPSWKDFRLGSIPGQFLLHEPHMRPKRFIASLSSILRLAKNLRTLSLSLNWAAGAPEELSDALRGLDKLEEVNVQCRSETPQQTYPYLAMWPTMKRLIMQLSWFDWSTKPIPTSPPGYVLTEATLSGRFRDEHLDYILSSSSSSLECLTICCLDLTNGGLRTALQGVANSLVELEIRFAATRVRNEEHALDSVIVHMEHLKSLTIIRSLASDLMIRRRADAFEKRRASPSRVALPVIELMIDQCGCPPYPDHNLVVTAASVWPGWAIKISEPSMIYDTI